MKRTVLIALTTMLVLSMHAQEAASSDSKKMWLSGNLGFNSGKTGDVNNSDWSVGPEFGFMLSDKLAIGASVAFTGRTDKGDNPGNNNGTFKNTSSGNEITPFVRYYFAGKEKFKFFGQLNINYEFGNTKSESTDGAGTTTTTDKKYDGFGVNVRPGAQYWFNDSWSMLATLGEIGYWTKTNDKGGVDGNGNSTETKNSNFGLEVDFSMTFGMVFHF